MAESTENEEAQGDEEVDQDALMAEWEAMADEGAEEDTEEPQAGVSTARVLDQTEIDSLLGVDGSGSGDDDASGIKAILNSALVSYERLPMLEVVFDRLVRMIACQMTYDLFEFKKEEMLPDLEYAGAATYIESALQPPRSSTLITPPSSTNRRCRSAIPRARIRNPHPSPLPIATSESRIS